LRRLALSVLLYAFLALPASALDRNAFSFTRYDLQATLDPHQHGLAVEGAVELRNTSQSPQREAVLQISSSLHWLSILNSDGEPVEWLEQSYTSDIDHTGMLNEVIVKLDKPVAPGGFDAAGADWDPTRDCAAQRLGRDQRRFHGAARSRVCGLVSGVDGCGQPGAGQ